MIVHVRKYKSRYEGLYVEIDETHVLLYKERYSINLIGLFYYDELNINLEDMSIIIKLNDEMTGKIVHALRIFDKRTD